jgi:hypothetical protein
VKKKEVIIDYYTQRTKEIIKEPYLKPLLYLIGCEHGINKDTVDKDYRKKYFKQHIIDYLKSETL